MLSRHGPPGRQLIRPEFIEEHKRLRIARAVGELACDVGTDALTVSMITKQAKIARNTYYELFANRDEGLRFSIDLGNQWLREAIEEAIEREGSWEEHVRTAIASLIEAVEADLSMAELALVFYCGVRREDGGPFDEALLETLEGVLRPGRTSGPPPGPGPRTEELLAYGILSVIAGRLQKGEGAALRELEPDLTELATLPFFGREPVLARVG